MSDKNELLIDETCIETFPCCHYCKLNGKEICLSGDKIYKWFIDHGKNVPEHFVEYKDFSEDDYNTE